MFRNLPPPGTLMRTTRALEVDGSTIPAGTLVRLGAQQRRLYESRDSPSDTFAGNIGGRALIFERQFLEEVK